MLFLSRNYQQVYLHIQKTQQASIKQAEVVGKAVSGPLITGWDQSPKRDRYI